MPIKVLVADKSEITRSSIVAMLQEHAAVELVGVSGNLPQTVHMANDLKPEVVVMDLYMCGEDAAAYADVKRILDHHVRGLAISLSNDIEAYDLAKRCGFDRLLDKMNLYTELVPAITELASI